MEKVVVSDDNTAKVVTASVGDLVTTAVSSSEHMTGFAGLAQKIGLLAAGASLASYYQNGTFNFTRRFVAPKGV